MLRLATGDSHSSDLLHVVGEVAFRYGGIRGVTRDLQVLATREDHEEVVLHTKVVLLQLEDLAELAQTNAEAELLQSILDFYPEISLVSPR